MAQLGISGTLRDSGQSAREICLASNPPQLEMPKPSSALADKSNVVDTVIPYKHLIDFIWPTFLFQLIVRDSWAAWPGVRGKVLIEAILYPFVFRL